MNVQNAREYTAYWMHKKGLKIDEHGQFTSGQRPSKLLRTMLLDYVEDYAEARVDDDVRSKALDKELLKMAFQEFIICQQLGARIELTKRIKFNGIGDDTQLKNYCRAVVGRDDPNTVTVVKHWCWQVKRNDLTKDVKYHIMPIFYGKTNGGKSTAVRSLIYIFAKLTLDTNLKTVLTTEKSGISMSENLIAFIDEMSGVNRIEMEGFKGQLTAGCNSVREYHTQNVIKVRQNVSFIGTSNRPVSEILFDITGMRRFFEVACQDKLDWAMINSIDYLELWQSIDENREEGYLPERSVEIAIEQEHLVGKDDIMAFMEFHNILPDDTNTRMITFSDLFNKFLGFCMGAGINKPDNAIWFAKKLQRYYRGTKKRLGSKSHTCYAINVSATVHEGSQYIPLEEKKVHDV